MTDLQVVRWVRFGHDRLYVKNPDGTQLGYWDNKNALACLDDEINRPAFDQAIAQYCAAKPDALSSARTSTVPALTAQGVQGVQAVQVLEVTNLQDPAPTVAPQPAPSAPAELNPAATIEWADLAENHAGAAAREQALALKHAAPVRTFLARCMGVKNDERAWRIGAAGEEAIAAQLAKLDNHWRTLHAVEVGNNGSDIDHVIIGPAGIYTINTKHHPDANIWVGGNTFIVNGQRVPYVRNTRFETKRTTAFLTTATGTTHPVTGIIAVVGAVSGFKVKAQPPGDDVYVLARKGLVKWLNARPCTLTDADINTLYEAARRSTTWRK